MTFFSAINQMDFSLLQSIQSFSNPILIQIMLAITFLGNPLFWCLAIAFVYWLGREDEGFYLANIILFSAVAVEALKSAIGRLRPSSEHFQIWAEDIYSNYGFPSGHTAIVAAYYGYFAKTINKNKKIILLLLVIAVAFSRLYLGVHFLTDVLAAIPIGYIIGKANFFLKEEIKHSHFKPTKLEDSLAIAGILAIALIALAFLEQIPLTGILVGFYCGFFLSKELNIQANKQTKKETIKKEIIGFLGLLVIILLIPCIAGIKLPSGQQGLTRTFIMYGAGGFWVSFGLPFIYHKILSKTTNI